MDMLLELDHISKIYGDLHAVDDLSLTVPQGEWLAIVGSSGSGKTTLMNMIGCMDTPSKGSVSLEGRKLEDLNAGQLADVRKNLIGLVFQKFYLVPHLTIADQKVEKVEIVGHPFTTISKNHQNDFAEAINGVVDGKPLKDLKVDKVAGASWTSDAFNKALEVARQEASIQ